VTDQATMTVEEASAYLGLSEDTIQRVMCGDGIPHIRVGRRVLFLRASLDRWLEKREAETTPRRRRLHHRESKKEVC